jgi:AraC-like DNA-binding protein
MARALYAAYRITKDPALALHLGSHAPTRMLDVVGDVLLHSATLRIAITEAQRYLTLLGPLGSLHLEEGTEVSGLVFQTPCANQEATRPITEIVMAFALRFARHYVGSPAKPVALWLAFSKPAHARAYEELFECPVRFGQERNVIFFESRILDEPQPFVDEPLHSLLKVRADELLRDARERRTLTSRVRDLLEHDENLATATLTRTAQRLGMSESGLRRRLREENTSWTNTLDDARREIAMRMLRMPDIPIKQIAEDTGFSEPSAFHRAFRRWTGSTPARFRAASLREDAPEERSAARPSAA